MIEADLDFSDWQLLELAKGIKPTEIIETRVPDSSLISKKYRRTTGGALIEGTHPKFDGIRFSFLLEQYENRLFRKREYGLYITARKSEEPLRCQVIIGRTITSNPEYERFFYYVSAKATREFCVPFDRIKEVFGGHYRFFKSGVKKW